MDKQQLTQEQYFNNSDQQQQQQNYLPPQNYQQQQQNSQQFYNYQQIPQNQLQYSYQYAIVNQQQQPQQYYQQQQYPVEKNPNYQPQQQQQQQQDSSNNQQQSQQQPAKQQLLKQNAKRQSQFDDKFFNFPNQNTEFFCDTCNRTQLSKTKHVIGEGSWTIAAFTFCFLGCLCLPFCLPQFQDVLHYCPECEEFVGVYQYRIFKKYSHD